MSVSKRGTASGNVRRAQFEAARRAIFGDDRIPGTQRERWTTAGVVHPFVGQTGAQFELGPFQFKLVCDDDNASIQVYLGKQQLCIIRKTDMLISLPELTEIVSFNDSGTVVSNVIRGKGRGTRREFNGKTCFFAHNGVVHYNIGSQNGVDRSVGISGSLYFPSNVAPNDMPKLAELYKSTKNLTHIGAKLSIVYSDDMDASKSGDQIPLIDFNWAAMPEGIVEYPEKNMTCLFSQGITGVMYFASGKLDIGPLKKYKHFPSENDEMCEFDNGSFWFYSDIEKYCDALSWLMHVLTGPDPRDYGAPASAETDERKYINSAKESSEPKDNGWFEFWRIPGGMWHMETIPKKSWRNFFRSYIRLQFFVPAPAGPTLAEMTLAQANVINTAVLTHLQSTRALPNALAVYMTGELDDRAPYPLAVFQAAQARRTRFEQYEYMGANCAGCGATELVGTCSTCGDARYCSRQCQQQHWCAHQETCGK